MQERGRPHARADQRSADLFERDHRGAPVRARSTSARSSREVVSDLQVDDRAGRAAASRSAELPEIEADPTQMRQLLQNLLSNALKFHRPGVPPVVRISARLQPPASRGARRGRAERCEVTVADNGIGFEPGVRRPHLRHLPAPARPRRLRRHRHRARHLPQDRRAPRRRDHARRASPGGAPPSSSRCRSSSGTARRIAGRRHRAVTDPDRRRRCRGPRADRGGVRRGAARQRASTSSRTASSSRSTCGARARSPSRRHLVPERDPARPQHAEEGRPRGAARAQVRSRAAAHPDRRAERVARRGGHPAAPTTSAPTRSSASR